MKKSLLLASASLAAWCLVSPALAADMRAPAPSYKAPMPMMAAIYDWSGFYIGINGGGGESRFGGGDGSASGGTVGAQVGYRWQATNWVFGLEAQGNWANFERTWATDPDNYFTAKTDSFGLFTGQVGYAWNTVLLYVKGGGAVVSNKWQQVVDADLAWSSNETRWGGTVGVGLDVGFSPNWTIGVEYNHIFLGSKDDVRQDVDMGLVRLNYRFGGPLVARY